MLIYIILFFYEILFRYNLFVIKYVYIDESGDLGFGNGASNYFTISAVVVNGAENNKKLKKIVETVIRRKLNYRNANKELELKGAKTSIGIKNYFYEKCRSIDFEIYAITRHIGYISTQKTFYKR